MRGVDRGSRKRLPCLGNVPYGARQDQQTSHEAGALRLHVERSTNYKQHGEYILSALFAKHCMYALQSYFKLALFLTGMPKRLYLDRPCLKTWRVSMVLAVAVQPVVGLVAVNV